MQVLSTHGRHRGGRQCDPHPRGRAGGDGLIDFSAVGHLGPIAGDTFADEGVILENSRPNCLWVGWLGDEALVGDDWEEHPTGCGPIRGTFSGPVSSLSVSLVPATQFTAEYTLKAFDANGAQVDVASKVVTEDSGDPESIGLGEYFDLSLAALPRPAFSFEVSSRWIRSSFVYNTKIAEFGMSTLSFNLVAHPSGKASCKRGGWRDLTTQTGRSFRNQGDCVGYVVSRRHAGRLP